jgi:phosphoribosylformimino-5-aminoimidazole carboxamide ribotide isomerase
MIIYPAIDLRGGQVVRLREGNPQNQTVFSDDPIKTASQWIDQGATWIHMVNLDGALATANNNLDILSEVAKQDVAIQFGGGIRQLQDIEDALERGAKRVVIGTLALKQPQIVAQAVETFGQEAICVALDARQGKVATHGWTQVSDMTPNELGMKMVDMGVRHALFTDVSRDGVLGGSNLQGTIDLAKHTQLKVIASGGVSSVAEIEQLRDSKKVAGVVIGMALYRGKIDLAEAIQATQQRENGDA